DCANLATRVVDRSGSTYKRDRPHYPFFGDFQIQSHQRSWWIVQAQPTRDCIDRPFLEMSLSQKIHTVSALVDLVIGNLNTESHVVGCRSSLNDPPTALVGLGIGISRRGRSPERSTPASVGFPEVDFGD